MSEKATVASTPASPAQPAAKKQVAKAKKPRARPTHPPTSEMVLAAVQTLKERNGSSLQAIKKYIVATYKVESEKQAPFIKKYLKTAVDQGILIQTKGKGASGSFKLPVSKSERKSKPKVEKVKSEKKPVKKATTTTSVAKKPTTTASATKKPKAAPGEKKVAAKKPAVAKKAAAAKKPPAKKEKVTKTAAAKPAKKSMAKKSAKSPAAKLKAPKPKKASVTKPAKTATKKK